MSDIKPEAHAIADVSAILSAIQKKPLKIRQILLKSGHSGNVLKLPFSHDFPLTTKPSCDGISSTVDPVVADSKSIGHFGCLPRHHQLIRSC
jgi:hypothetical protein